MDEIVKAALKKWPNVPACRDWLGLDARGDWYLRDEAAQAAGAFPRVKGSRIEHEGLRDFIGRNYLPDERGAWFFQNGPQRVYVELEAAPWIWRVSAEGTLHSHTGRPAPYRAALVDEGGRLYVETGIGLGLVHTLDMEPASELIEHGHWQVESVRAADLPARCGFRASPAADERDAAKTKAG